MIGPQTELARLIGTVPVIPVLVIERLEDAVPIATALVSGGLKVLEVTLRTDAALGAVERISAAVPSALVGVGSVIDAGQFASARRAGARFAVSPGATPALHAAALEARLPWLPGAQTLSEVMDLRERGLLLAKFFPAHYSGGVNFLRALAGPVPDMRFCPTGGISPATAPDYLALGNVSCVGGSWLTPANLVAGRKWKDIELLAQHACTLRLERAEHAMPALR
jgi:2-dehydro-3-deoxyphosphogluconate aldolase/(4S)-4-hydroxy-2-oxoglutarate aldolase